VNYDLWSILKIKLNKITILLAALYGVKLGLSS